MVAVKEFIENGGDMTKVSVSAPDKNLAETLPSEFEQGFIARNPLNHEDIWYVSKAYHEANLELAEETKEETFLDRLIREEQELGEKIAGLAKALNTDGFAEKVGDYQFDLLCVQHSAMLTYRKVLRMRIADLKNQS